MSTTKNVNRDSLMDVISAEIGHHAGADIHLPEEDPSLQSFKARVLDQDYKKAEAIVATSKPTILETLRVELGRGAFTAAREILESLDHRETNPTVLAEIAVEEARLLIFEGRWDEALRVLSRAMNMDQTSISRMALYQMRAVVHFELSRFAEALKDLELVAGFGKLYSESHLSHFGEMTRIRIQARTIGVNEARKTLGRLWSALSALGQLDANLLIPLARTEIDIARLAGQSHTGWAWLAYRLSEITGENFYRDLAVLDLSLSGSEAARDFALGILEVIQSQNPRVNSLLEEISDRAGVWTATADAMRLWKRGGAPATENGADFSGAKVFVLPEQGLMLSLNPLEIKPLKKGRPRDAMLVLSKNPMGIPYETLFASVWGPQKYVHHLHDGLIRNLLYRVRNASGLETSTDGGKITSPGLVSVSP